MDLINMWNGMAQSDLTLGIRNLNGIGRLVCLVGLAVHAGIALYASPYILLLLVGSYAVAIYGIYRVAYLDNFLTVSRFDRTDVECPSNSRTPKFVDSIETRTKEEIRARRASMKNVSTECDLLTPAQMEHKKRADPRPTICIGEDDMHIRLQDREANLDMNHVKMSWGQFLNAYLMIVPSAFLLQIIGLTKLTVRKWLHRHGLVKPRRVHYGEEVAKLCLESMQAIHFTGFKEEKIAVFAWADFPYVLDENVTDAGADISYADLFVVDIDVSSTTKRFVQAKLDDRELTAKEAYILINLNIIIHAHTKIHALANWGLNTDNADPFVRWNSVVTVMYNYFGCTAFQQLASCYGALGILKYDYTVFLEFFDLGISEGVPPHGNIRQLMKHSSLVKFVIGTRNIFLNVFEDYKADFMGMDGEAMFAGTVIHSLDHTMYTTQIKDALWLDHDDGDFGFMADSCQLIFEGFSKDLPLLPFNRRYKNATHPFYKAVYEGAKQLNPWLAARMDTCIIK